MRAVNVAEAKKSLSDLLGAVAYGGERVLISRRGRPMAMLVPVGAAGDRHLADTRGWLDDDDPFFVEMKAVVQDRQAQVGRAVQLQE